MDKFNNILLDVWRETCHRLEIDDSTQTIVDRLTPHLPIGQIIVQQINSNQTSLQTVAFACLDENVPSTETEIECSTSQMKRIMTWHKKGEVIRRSEPSSQQGQLRFLRQYSEASDWIAGPLKSPSGILGVLLFIAAPGNTFQARHVKMLTILLEPFSFALDNDHRFRELTALREAAEADKQSLLNRLGRRDIDDTIVGSASSLRTVMERVNQVAPSNAPVLILGETGAGKELIARTIHKRSNRAQGPILRVNCGAIPPELIDSQLFGHERGAFTGAIETYKGWFERADKGTIFLDEIGELPQNAQVRLLHVLQDGWLERVGGHHPIKVDVRVIAATHCDLAAMVQDSRFRDDLWYRIAVFPILLPPLRDRLDDIPLLAKYFAERSAIRFGLPIILPSEEDTNLLRSYSWPGNIREFGSIMDRAALLGNGNKLEVAKALGVLPSPIKTLSQGSNTQDPQTAAPPILPLDEAMRIHIKKALTFTKGRVEGPHGAAALLQINHHTLRARMRKLGIDWTQFRFSTS